MRETTAKRKPQIEAMRTYVPRDGTPVTFRCESCGHEVHDLRSIFLSHRAGAWRIECSEHPEAEYEVDGGRVFGGGLHALDVFADLAGARWFDAADLFRTFLRLRAQASGLYVAPRPAGDGE